MSHVAHVIVFVIVFAGALESPKIDSAFCLDAGFSVRGRASLFGLRARCLVSSRIPLSVVCTLWLSQKGPSWTLRVPTLY